MENYFVRNLETDKLELHFDKATYKALSFDQRKDVKSYFLFSRQAEAWVSKAKITGGLTGGYSAEKIAKEIGLVYAGETGTRKTALEQVVATNQKEDRRKEYLTSVDDNTFIEWEQYTPSDRLSQNHNSISFYNHDYPKSFKSDLNETIADIKQRLKVEKENELPTYIKTAVERYAKALSGYYSRYVSNRMYAPSPMVVGPARYPWHRLDKVHGRDGRNFADLDEAKARLKKAVERASPQAFNQRKSLPYLQNRIDEASKDVRFWERAVEKGDRKDAEPRLAQSTELLNYWNEQLAEVGGLKFTKQILIDGQATHIRYSGKLYPIVRLNDKTVTMGKWYNHDPKIVIQVPYSGIGGFATNWDDALIRRPGEKAPKKDKVVKAFKKGDKAYYIRETGIVSSPRQEVFIVTIKSVGPKNYGITGSYYGSIVPHEKLKPIGFGHVNRLAQLLKSAEQYKADIITNLTDSDQTGRYDLKYLLDYGIHSYRHSPDVLKQDLISAGYPDKGGLVAFFRDKYGLDGKKNAKAKPAKNAKYRTSATKKRAINTVKKEGKSIKSRLQAAKERIAQRRGVEPNTIKAYLDTDTNVVREKRPKATVQAEKSQRKASKGSTEKPKLTKQKKAEIVQKGVDQAEAATGKKKPLTAAQVIKIGRKIDYARYNLFIDGEWVNVREDFDSKSTNKRRLAPTEENLIKWAKKPGRYDLIGVDNAGRVDVTVHRKKDRNKVPLSLKAPKVVPQLKKLLIKTAKNPAGRKTKPRKKP